MTVAGVFSSSGSDPRVSLSMRQTLALAVFAIGLAATLAAAWGTGKEMRLRLERQVSLSLSRHAAQLAATLDRALYDRWRDLEVAATLDAARLSSGSERERRDVLDRIAAAQPDYAWVGYADRNGIVRAAAGDLLVGQDVRGRPWFAGGMARMHAGDVHEAVLLSKTGGRDRTEPLRLLDLAAPVRDGAGGTVGVLAAHFPLDWIAKVDESLRPHLPPEMAGLEVLVLSRDRSVVYGPARDTGRILPVPPLDRGHEGPGRAVEGDGRANLVAVSPTHGYRGYPGLGWSVLVRQDEATALVLASDLERGVLARGLPLSLVATALAYLLADVLKRPLDGLRSAAAAIGRGEAVVRPGGIFHEFRQIGDALDAAAADLREREARLRAEKERFAFALEGANDGLWDWDVATGRVWYSPRWLDMLGYRPGELDGHFSAWERLVHPEDKDGVLAALDGHRRGDSPYYEAEHRLRHKHGHWVWVLTRGKIVERDAEGRPVRAVGTHTDIGARKGAEEALRASEARFRTLFERAPIGIADVTTGCRFSQVNDLFCEIVGHPREELIGRTFQEITHPDDVDADAAQVRDLLAGRIPHYGMEKRYVRKDGSVVWAYLAVGLVRNEFGRPCYFLSSVKNITARKEAERALRESETFARSVIEASADCIKVLDLDGRVRFMNSPGLCAMEVEDFACIRGGDWARFWPEGMRGEIERAVAEARDGGQARFVAFCPTMKGAPKWWDVCVTPVLGPDGRPERLLVISREVTDLKAAEERLHLLMGELNHRVKNLLATVQAVMRLSARPGDDLEAYKGRVLSRIANLARTNEVLVRGSWSGAGLRELLLAELDAYDLRERLTLDGPDTVLQASQAVPVAMIVHEMTTNAAKYGALSVAEGRLAVRWVVEVNEAASRLCLTWTESGGPPVTPPARKGFGSRLMQDALARELDGQVRIDYPPEGVAMALTAPMP